MSTFTAIDLDKLPAPTIIEQPGYETILQALRDWLVQSDPALESALALESEPLNKVLEAWAYREVLLRAQINDAGRGNMLAFAQGAQLDHLAAFYGVARQVLHPGDPNARPPLAPVLEDDTRFRTRVQLALEGATTAGPRGSYVFWALSAASEVKDVSVTSPSPGEVLITVLSALGDGAPSDGLLSLVADQLNGEDIRPLTDHVTVQAAVIVPYTLHADLQLFDGPDAELVRTAALGAVQAYVSAQHRLGRSVSISGLHAALHQPGVQKVTLSAPQADIDVAQNQAAHCTSLTLTMGDGNG